MRRVTLCVKQRDAVTLIELLVSMALLCLLVVLLFGIVDGATKLWRQNETRAESYREARAALMVMSRDLRNVIGHTGGFLLNETAFQRLPGEAVTNAQASAIFFLSAFPSYAQDPSGDASDVCEVGYFLAEGVSSAVSGDSGMNEDALIRTRNLYRYFRSSDQTFSNVQAEGTFTNITLLGAETELLARNVQAITIAAYRVENGEPSPFALATNATLPDLLDVSIVVLNQDAVRKISGPSGATNGAAADIAERAAKTFVTRVRLRSQP